MNKIILSNMEDGSKESGFLLLTGLEEKTTKNGGAYCVFSLSDGTKNIEANLWNHTKEDVLAVVQIATVIAVELHSKLYNEKLTYEVKKYYPGDESIDIGEFILKAPYKPEEMFDEILRLCHSTIKEGDSSINLSMLVEDIYNSNKDKLLYWSAAKAIHHNYYAGLLYHTFRMLRQATVLTRVYPSLNAELLYAAVALHDIGKIVELDTDSLGVSQYSIEGSLLGHLGIGMEIVSNAGSKLGIDKEKMLCLKHCIASHHGNLEWGALVKPSIKEAEVLFLIDMIDSRMEMFEKIEDTLEPGTLSDRIFGLDTKVYKPNIG